MSFFPPRHRNRGGNHAPGPLAERGFLLLLVTTLGMFANHAPLLSVVPLWSAEGGSGHGGVGATTGVTMATTVGIQLCMGPLLRRFGPYRLLAAGGLLLGVPTFGYPLSADLAWVLSVSAVRGLGFGIITVAGSALVAELTTPAQRGRAVGWYGIAVGLPQVVFLPLGVWAAESFGFTMVFLVTGASSALAAPLVVAGMPRRRAGGGTPLRGGPRSAAGRLRPLAAPGTLMVVSACALGGITSFLPLALEGAAAAPAALFTLSAAMIAGRWAAGAWSDRTGMGRLLVPGTVMCAAGMGGLAAAAAALPVPAVAAAGA
ncbi:MFS transporter, partial [Thermobifida halotolerans]|uniref:MFS transporter n=1 Tax=Thermobifida halotolerans TaxID=483545 RepID=UPI001F44328D